MQFHLECPLTFAKYTKELRLVVISSLKWKLRHPRGLKAMNLYRSELMEWKDSFNYFFLSHFMPFPWYIHNQRHLLLCCYCCFLYLAFFPLAFKGEICFYHRFIVSTNCSSSSSISAFARCFFMSRAMLFFVFLVDVQLLSINLN